MPDYIPAPEAEYDDWLTNLVTYASENREELGLTESHLAPLVTSFQEWQTASAEHKLAQTAADTAYQNKVDKRDLSQAQARTLVQILQANPKLTDAQRVALGITVRSSARSLTPVPTTRPLPRLEQSGRLRHTIHFVDESTPTRRAKPKGVRGCQIWVYVGETPPPKPEEFQYLGTDTRTPYLNEFDPEDGGEVAHYYLRWVNTKDEPGPWSDPISATILA